MNKKLYFLNKKGNKICGVLEEGADNNSPVVLFCHGFHSTKDNSTNVKLQELLKEQNIASFRFDFFGHGESEGKFEDITISEAVDDALCAIDFLKELGYSKIGIIGSSFGGITALLAAAKSKEIIFLGLKCPATNFLEIELMHRSKENLEKWKKRGYSYYTNNEGESYRLKYKFFKDLKKNNGFTVADKIKIPTLIVHGDVDETVPIRQSQHIYKLIPNCKLEIIPGADHRFSRPINFDKMIEILYQFVLANVK
jgi:pimeloyl-ACP methyl ester carboxylesterase